MSDERYCDNENCAACDLQRHMQHILDSGCPPEDLLKMTIHALAEVVSDDIEIQTVDVPRETSETMH